VSTDALEALDELLGAGGEPDDVLRAAVALVVERTPAVWAAIAFVESGSLVRGPDAGVADEARRVRVPIRFQGSQVGELWVDGQSDRVVLERVAERLSEHVLIGWDTSGRPWEP
jgi:hypothetical protein